MIVNCVVDSRNKMIPKSFGVLKSQYSEFRNEFPGAVFKEFHFNGFFEHWTFNDIIIVVNTFFIDGEDGENYE